MASPTFLINTSESGNPFANNPTVRSAPFFGRISQLRREADLHAHRAGRWTDFDPRRAGSVGIVLAGCRHAERFPDSRRHCPQGIHHAGAGFWPELHDRWADDQQRPKLDRQGPWPRRRADPGQPVPLDQFPQGRDRTGHRHHPIPGEAGQRERHSPADRRVQQPQRPQPTVRLPGKCTR